MVFIYFLNFQDMFKSDLMCSSLSFNPPGCILWLLFKNRSEIVSGLISPNLRSCSIKNMLGFLFAFCLFVCFILVFLKWDNYNIVFFEWRFMSRPLNLLYPSPGVQNTPNDDKILFSVFPCNKKIFTLQLTKLRALGVL